MTNGEIVHQQSTELARVHSSHDLIYREVLAGLPQEQFNDLYIQTRDFLSLKDPISSPGEHFTHVHLSTSMLHTGAAILSAALDERILPAAERNEIYEVSQHTTMALSMGIFGELLQDEEGKQLFAQNTTSTAATQIVRKKVDEVLTELHNNILVDPDWAKKENIQAVTDYGAETISQLYILCALSPSQAVAKNTYEKLLDMITVIQQKHTIEYRAADVLLDSLIQSWDADTPQLVEMVTALEEDGLPAARIRVIRDLLGHGAGALKRLQLQSTTKRKQAYELGHAINETIIPANVANYLSNNDPIDPEDTNKAEGITLKPMELEWEVLPPGKLQDHAREIVKGINRYTPTEVDLERLKTLEEVRCMWGAENCYYAKGSLGKRRMIRSSSGEPQPDEYILLVLQQRDTQSKVVAEHIVAESPITRRNAMYIYREDVSPEHSWRTAMSVEKSKAVQMGARAVKHVNRPGSMPISEKVVVLLSCKPEEFHKIQFAGVQGFRIPKDVVQVG